MLFRDLFSEFVSGVPIKRKHWGGYWVYKRGKIEMHTKEGDVVDFLQTEDVLFTISNLLQDDWVVLNRVRDLKEKHVHQQVDTSEQN